MNIQSLFDKVYYFIFQRLSWEGVNINEVISTSNEFTILMDETQVNTAWMTLLAIYILEEEFSSR